MSNPDKKEEFPTRYDFSSSEEALYRFWEEGKYFEPRENGEKEAFSIMMPPPNATGTLHLGHAARLTTEDILARYHRMKGDETLYLPGTDHAAIATHSKVEKILKEETGQSRHDIGREAFLEKVKDYVAESRDTIRNQVRKMGTSCDWSREAYTLSDDLNKAVFEFFKMMYEDELIYRGDRIVNWDPSTQTTVSDDEIQHEEEKATFYTFKYGPFEIGTARPETKFGDKYVVMHPDDERYKEYKHGDTFECEWINGPITATIIKDEAADPEFGTGVMTITPWHSVEDFEIAERHKLDREQIIDLEGKLLPIAEEFKGQTIEEARAKIVKKLEDKELLIKEDEEYVHNLAINERGGVIEPQIMKQWFVDVNKPAVDWKGEKRTIKETLQDAVHSKDIEILPERFEKTYFHWIDNLRDWCVSRQIWWGHRIPVWYPEDSYGDETKAIVSQESPKTGYVQDEDTLDTWFSSALWTFSTLGWPEKTADLERFHPTNVLETGYDIMFHWVARMILASTYTLGEIPFKTAYLSGLIRDREGRKMSKSLGNGIDPLEMIDKYGTDALRLSLIVGTTPGNDLNLYEDKIKGYRNFATKLWNVARFTLEKFPDTKAAPEPKTLADKWILSRLAKTTQDVSKNLEEYGLGIGAEKLYTFVWHELADWYVELLKSDLQKDSGATAHYVLEQTLRLLHPYTPFITEEIWKQLDPETPLIISKWPTTDLETDEESEELFTAIQEMMNEIRGIRGSYNLPWRTAFDAKLEQDLNDEQRKLLEHLGNIQLVETLPKGADAKIKGLTLSIEGLVDTDAELKRIEKEIEDDQNYISRIEKKLANKRFALHAPKEIVDEQKEKMKNALDRVKALEEQKKRLR